MKWTEEDKKDPDFEACSRQIKEWNAWNEAKKEKLRLEKGTNESNIKII